MDDASVFSQEPSRMVALHPIPSAISPVAIFNRFMCGRHISLSIAMTCKLCAQFVWACSKISLTSARDADYKPLYCSDSVAGIDTATPYCFSRMIGRK
jgi:hypothetical protein